MESATGKTPEKFRIEGHVHCKLLAAVPASVLLMGLIDERFIEISICNA
jgi:hypothetical protein